MLERTFADIFQEIIGNVQDIVRSEVRLAKTEIKEEANQAARASGVLVGGVALGLYAAGFFFLTIVYALSIVLPAWLAALLVTVFLGFAAAIMVTSGLKRLRQVDKPVYTIQTLKENFQWAKDHSR
jgi:uncharacterized membrane protein YqjE